MKKKDSLDRIADALEWANYWRWYYNRPAVYALDEGTGPPPPPPPPPQNDEPIGGG